MPDFQIKATVSDPYDGLNRLLGDAERFGFRLISANLRSGGSSNRVEMRFAAGEIGCDVIRARLSRHPCISELRAVETDRNAYPEEGVETQHV